MEAHERARFARPGLEALDIIPGATIWHLGDGTVLQAARGKLYTCKCTAWNWSCQEIDGNWYCRQICFAWSCTEVPALPKLAILGQEQDKPEL